MHTPCTRSLPHCYDFFSVHTLSLDSGAQVTADCGHLRFRVPRGNFDVLRYWFDGPSLRWQTMSVCNYYRMAGLDLSTTFQYPETVSATVQQE